MYSFWVVLLFEDEDSVGVDVFLVIVVWILVINGGCVEILGFNLVLGNL